MAQTDRVFSGSIPALYERYLGPLIFEPYADLMAERVAAARPARILETAAGTGILTRALARALPSQCEIIATDLNQPMLDFAAAQEGVERVKWRQADALALLSPSGRSTSWFVSSARCFSLTGLPAIARRHGSCGRAVV
jgi:trans-aconitate methyltransferase